MPETENPDPSPSEPDGENVLRDLRLQLETVKARMQAHRETMQAAGLANTRPPPTEEQDGSPRPRSHPPSPPAS